MANSRDVTLVVKFVDKGSANVKKFSRELLSLSGNMDKLKGIAAGVGKALAFTGLAAGAAAIYGMVKAAKSLSDQLKDGVSLAGEYRRAFNKFEATARSMGGAAKQVGYGAAEIKRTGDSIVAIARPVSTVEDGIAGMKQQVRDLAKEMTVLTGRSGAEFVDMFAKIYSQTKDFDLSAATLRASVDLAAGGTKGMDELPQVVENMTRAVSSSDVGGIYEFAPALREIGLEAMDTAERIKAIQASVDGVAAAMATGDIDVAKGGMIQSIREFFSTFADDDALNRFSEGFGKIRDSFFKLKESSPLQAVGTEMSKAFLEIGTSVEGLITSLSQADTQTAITKLLEDVGLLADEKGQSIFTAASGGVKSLVEAFKEWVAQGDMGSLGDSLRGIRESLIGKNWDRVTDTAEKIMTIVSALEALAYGINEVMKGRGPAAVSNYIAGIGKSSGGFFDQGAGMTDEERRKGFNDAFEGLPPAPGGGGPAHFSGGAIDGPWGIDKVPALLSRGEVVLNKSQQLGIGALTGMPSAEAFRQAGVPGFYTGGGRLSLGEQVAAPPIVGSFHTGPFAKRVSALSESGDTAGLEQLARQIGSLVLAARRFPAIGTTASSSAGEANRLETMLKRALLKVGSSQAGWSVERWAKGYQSGGSASPRSSGMMAGARRSMFPISLRAQSEPVVIQTMITDETGMRKVTKAIGESDRSAREREYSLRGFEGYGRNEYAYGSQ